MNNAIIEAPTIQVTMFEFDYSNLSFEQEEIVRGHTQEIKTMVRRTVMDILQTGKRLIEVKRILGHGKYLAWLDAEFGWTDQTARNFMNVYRSFKSKIILDLPICNTAIYLLAENSTPDKAREEAITRAQDGEYITVQLAKEIIKRWRRDRGLYSSESNEWYTPDKIIFRVLKTMGSIDLDPCSNSHTTPNVPALQHYTEEDNGLSHRWMGSVFMNPPYGRVIAEWVSKLVDGWKDGDVTEAIALVPSRTDTRWFREMREFPRCFIWGRIKFSENSTPAPFPSMAVYIGMNVDKFIEAFSDIGDIYGLQI